MRTGQNTHIWVYTHTRVELLDQRACASSIFTRLIPKYFLKWLYQLIFTPAMQRVLVPLHLLSIFGIIQFFNFCKSGECKVCFIEFIIHISLISNETEHLFNMFLRYSCFLSVECLFLLFIYLSIELSFPYWFVEVLSTVICVTSIFSQFMAYLCVFNTVF